MSTDIAFSREFLRDIKRIILKTDPTINLAKAWVISGDRKLWEFHYGDFYWFGRAHNAYEARANGWHAYLLTLVKESA